MESVKTAYKDSEKIYLCHAKRFLLTPFVYTLSTKFVNKSFKGLFGYYVRY